MNHRTEPATGHVASHIFADNHDADDNDPIRVREDAQTWVWRIISIHVREV